MSDDDTDKNDGRDGNAGVDLAVPGNLRYSDEHVWVEDLDGLFAIGITEYATERMGALVFADLPEVGARLEAGDEAVELESAKAVQPIISPVAGVIRHVNQAVAEDPEIINNDPYGEGWVLKLEPDDDQPELLDADQYAELLRTLQ